MTKQHFQALAVALRDARPSTNPVDERHLAWSRVREQVMVACMLFNPRFDRTKFIMASEGLANVQGGAPTDRGAAIRNDEDL